MPSRSVPVLQRKCACGGSGPASAGGSCEGCAKKRQLQRDAAGPAPAHAPPLVHEVLRAPGRPLDDATRGFMEPRFGHRFSDVRVHDDARAAASARAVGAHAYTVGSHVVFGEGRHAPGSTEGRSLLAHELAHVVQQRGASSAPPQRLAVSPGGSDDRLEREASEASALVAQGRGAGRLSLGGAGLVQRAKICSKRLDAPVAGWVANHAYIDDTGQENCRGSGMVGNYAIQRLVSGNFVRGCGAKTDTSDDPQSYPPNMKPCTPKPGVTDVSACLRAAFNAYADPSVYSNAAVVAGGAAGAVVGGGIGARLGGLWGAAAGAVGGFLGGAAAGAASPAMGPNSNTFAATLARACCADASSTGLGFVPGWDHAPATPCTAPPAVAAAGQAPRQGETG